MKIKIYQVDQERDEHRVKFCGLQEMQNIQRSQGRSVLVDPAIYNEVLRFTHSQAKIFWHC